METAPFRIAIREEEDGWIYAYFARIDTMDDAVKIMGIRKDVVELDQDRIFEGFKIYCHALAISIMENHFNIFGARVEERTPHDEEDEIQDPPTPH